MTIPVKINKEKIAAQNFLGFGAEWDSYDYDTNNVTDKDLVKEEITNGFEKCNKG